MTDESHSDPLLQEARPSLERPDLSAYLKDGETPAECIARNRADVDTALGLLANEKRLTEELRRQLETAEDFQRDYARRVLERQQEAQFWKAQLEVTERELWALRERSAPVAAPPAKIGEALGLSGNILCGLQGPAGGAGDANRARPSQSTGTSIQTSGGRGGNAVGSGRNGIRAKSFVVSLPSERGAVRRSEDAMSVKPQKYECVTQLQRDSWEYRLKPAGAEPNEDDLVRWDDALAMSDRAVMGHDAWDKKQVGKIESLRAQLLTVTAERDELREERLRTRAVYFQDTAALDVELSTLRSEGDRLRAVLADYLDLRAALHRALGTDADDDETLAWRVAELKVEGDRLREELAKLKEKECRHQNSSID